MKAIILLAALSFSTLSFAKELKADGWASNYMNAIESFIEEKTNCGVHAPPNRCVTYSNGENSFYAECGVGFETFGGMIVIGSGNYTFRINKFMSTDESYRIPTMNFTEDEKFKELNISFDVYKDSIREGSEHLQLIKGKENGRLRLFSYDGPGFRTGTSCRFGGPLR